MKSRLVRALLIGGSATAAVAIGVATASAAAPTFTVKAGSAATGTAVAFKGATTAALTFKDTTTNQTLTCAASTAPGSTKVGTKKPGAAIATITGASTTWKTCTGPVGLKFTVKGAGTWNLNATSGTTKGVTGSITAVSATVSDPGTCTFSVTGSVSGTYTNAGTLLALPGTTSTLKISKVTGCLGIINNNDVASFKANYKVTATVAAYNPLAITSP